MTIRFLFTSCTDVIAIFKSACVCACLHVCLGEKVCVCVCVCVWGVWLRVVNVFFIIRIHVFISFVQREFVCVQRELITDDLVL